MKKSKKVVIALSGGVDSAVAAYLLKKEGYEVLACHAICFDKDVPYCTSSDDKKWAIKIADFLNIPIKIYDLTKEYEFEVINYFVNEYKSARTPNPDSLCNKEIKFNVLMNKALTDLNADFFATGHYAQIEKDNLFEAKDITKDQSYFLAQIDKRVLSKVLYPLGSLLKTKVREIAKKINLPNFDKKDSQGICFIGNVKLSEFLKDYIEEKKGDVKNLKNEIIGTHNGVMFYTIGQRHGFDITKYNQNPMYVIKKDIENNILYVDEKEYAYTNKFVASNINKFIEIDENLVYKVRVRHLGEKYNCKIVKNNTNLEVEILDGKIFAISSGQIAVFYNDNKVCYSGVIQ